MEGISNFVVKRRKLIVILTLILTVVFVVCFFKVKINYNMTDYLPEDANSTIALDMLDEEFGEAVPNCNVMVEDVSITQALSLKEQLENIKGVENVSWLDDAVDLKQPLETQDSDIIDDYYIDNTALFSVTIEDGKERATTDRIAKELGGDVKMSGTAVEQADNQRLAVAETVRAIAVIGPLIILLLIIATTSWIEPFLYLTAIGVAVFINLGSEIFRGEISYVTLAVAPILQLAVSLDYAVFLSSSYEKHRKTEQNDTKAMVAAMKESITAILGSALTTIFGFFALCLMDFRIGPDMGVSLVKGVILSLVSCMTFLPALIMLLNKLIDKTRHKKFMPDFTGAGKVAVRLRIPAMALVILISGLCLKGQALNQYTYGSGDEASNTESATAIKEKFGESNIMVLLVPNTDCTKEKLLSEKIGDMEHVTSVISYATQVGNTIPPEYLSLETTENFYGENYARIIIYSNLPDECEESFKLVEDVRTEAARYYGEDVWSCGQSANLYDMKHTVVGDNTVVSTVTVVAIFLVLAILMKSWLLPIILILTIKLAIWINMSIPFFTGQSLIYLGYLIVSTVQMGATIDYAILLTDHYTEKRKHLTKIKAMEATMAEVAPAILVSAFVLAIAGFALSLTSSSGMVKALGVLIGRGALIPLIVVNLFLPGVLILLDKVLPYTMIKAEFCKEDEAADEEIGTAGDTRADNSLFGYIEPEAEESYDDTDDSVSWDETEK